MLKRILSKMIDQNETYGRHVIEQFARRLPPIQTVVDLGAGPGTDLAIVKSVHPSCSTTAIEAGSYWPEYVGTNYDRLVLSNIERDELQFEPGQVDLIIANQILEHTKEIFWIFDQVTRALKVGGHFLIGVPNVLSFHNRLLMLAGNHPTQHKLASAHVRVFSKTDTMNFVEECFPGGYSLQAFSGSQFYPFPRPISRALSAAFPGLAFSIFFLLRKEKEYDGQFRAYPKKAGLETNFWAGPDTQGATPHHNSTASQP